uniref:Probable peptidoglycan glycosyltransferase FtsW n=1 Tax=candidate division WOR-3 bacterium TaxID=2052148 RepID=A0A7C3UVQ3_UNCW3
MKPKIDLIYLQAVILLLIFGILSLYSTTFYERILSLPNPQGDYFKKTLTWVGIGLLVLFLSIIFPTSFYRSQFRLLGIFKFPFTGSFLLWIIFFSCLLFNVSRVLITKQVARSTGFFQPQEFFKYAHLFLLANLAEKGKNDWRIIVLSLLATLALFFQRAVGTAVIFFFSCLFIFFIIRMRITYILLYTFIIGISIAIGIWKIRYARERFEQFWERKEKRKDLMRIDWRNLTHQENARIAIASGGWFGRGLGRGLQKFGFLVLVHTDFLFANICEEMGFVGAMLILSLFFILFWRGLLIASAARSGFEFTVASGVSIILCLYLFVHVLVGLDILPCTGQPLPFLSYGGSALISNLWAAGTVLNISYSERR